MLLVQYVDVHNENVPNVDSTKMLYFKTSTGYLNVDARVDVLCSWRLCASHELFADGRKIRAICQLNNLHLHSTFNIFFVLKYHDFLSANKQF